MMKNIAIRICDRNDKPMIHNCLIEDFEEDNFIEELGHDLSEIGSYVDEVFY